MQRIAWTTLVGLALCVQPAVAQNGTLPSWLLPPHHAEGVPDYIAAIASRGLPPIRIPDAPVATDRFALLHRDERVPDYLASVRPTNIASIPIPPPPRGEAPAVVRGVYMNGWVFSSSRFFDLLSLADTTEINAFVIDVKDATGYITYRSSVSTAEEIGANGLVRIRDSRSRLAILEAHGIHPIARIVVARDPLLAKNKPDWAIRDSVTGGLWRDGLGDAWVDAFNDSVWGYAADLAAEAVLMGFKEIQFDYVRFPSGIVGEGSGQLDLSQEERVAAIASFLEEAKRRITPMGCAMSADVFGIIVSRPSDQGIGQRPEDLSPHVDAISPMVYPSHYSDDWLGLADPNEHPYDVTADAIDNAIPRLAPGTELRPWLQAFFWTNQQIRRSIQAAEDRDVGWILWNSVSNYSREAIPTDAELATP